MAMWSSQLPKLAGRLSSQVPTYVVEEFIEEKVPNRIFEAVNIYLGKKLSQPTLRIKVNDTVISNNNDSGNKTNMANYSNTNEHQEDEKKPLRVEVDKNQQVVDSFKGVDVKWAFVFSGGSENPNWDDQIPVRRYFELKLGDNSHRDHVFLDAYLNYILQKSEQIKADDKSGFYMGAAFVVTTVLGLGIWVGVGH